MASQNEVSTKLDMAVAVGRGSMVNYGAVTLRIHPGRQGDSAEMPRLMIHLLIGRYITEQGNYYALPR